MRKVLIVGAGAVGSLFAARLTAAAVPVLLIGRRDHVAAIGSGGLTVEGIDAGTFRPEAATTIPAGLAPEATLLTTKSFDLAAAAGQLAEAVAPVPTGLLGNGLGIEETASAALQGGGWPRPELSLVRVVHTVPATLLGPGRVRASGRGEVVLPEPSMAGQGAPAVKVLLRLLSAAGFLLRTSRSFEVEIWRKVVVNAAINPVTAVHRVPNGALRDGPLRAEAELLLSEAVEVAQRATVAVSLETAGSDFERVVEATAANRSSMLQDIERGRPTEIDAISGEVLRRGERLGLRLPATRRAIHEVQRLASAASPSAQR